MRWEVIAFDFFFTEPYYLAYDDEAVRDWAAVLLFVIALDRDLRGLAQSRRRAMEAREAAERDAGAKALGAQRLSKAVAIEILQAATALHRIFRAPAAILMQCENRGRGDSGKRTNYRGRPGGRAGRYFRRTNTPEGIPIAYVGAYFDFSADLDVPDRLQAVSWASILCMRRVNGRIHPNKSSR